MTLSGYLAITNEFIQDEFGGVVPLAEVRLQEGESLENALRRFKRKVQQEDIIKEVKRHSFYLKPGEKKQVRFTLAPSDLMILNREMQWVVEPGRYQVLIGASSDIPHWGACLQSGYCEIPQMLNARRTGFERLPLSMWPQIWAPRCCMHERSQLRSDRLGWHPGRVPKMSVATRHHLDCARRWHRRSSNRMDLSGRLSTLKDLVSATDLWER